jgi:hypothetical protein
VRLEVRTLAAIVIVALLASSPALARKAHHYSNRAVKHQSATKKADRGGVERHPDDIALDRKIGSICRGC